MLKITFSMKCRTIQFYTCFWFILAYVVQKNPRSSSSSKPKKSAFLCHNIYCNQLSNRTYVANIPRQMKCCKNPTKQINFLRMVKSNRCTEQRKKKTKNKKQRKKSTRFTDRVDFLCVFCFSSALAKKKRLFRSISYRI